MSDGKIFAISTGPGSSDLITVRGARILGNLDVLYVPAAKRGGDSFALRIVRDYLAKDLDIRARHFPMSAGNDEKEAAWDSIAEEMLVEAQSGKRVGFVSLGDTMLYSTWVFLLKRLHHRVEIEVVPGVTSFAAIASAMQFPLAMEEQSMAVLSCTAPEAALEAALMQHDSAVLMKVYGRFAQIKALLDRLNLLNHAVMMSDASTDSEQGFRCLSELADDVPLSYFSTILVNRRWCAADAL